MQHHILAVSRRTPYSELQCAADMLGSVKRTAINSSTTGYTCDKHTNYLPCFQPAALHLLLVHLNPIR